MSGIERLLQHASVTRLSTSTRFTAPVMQTIEAAIRALEARHPGEIRFVVETRLSLQQLLARVSPRARALDLFGLLRVWDTEHNTGVLIYVLLAERTVEIVADRGLARHISLSQWDQVCRQMETEYRAGHYAEGSVAGIERIGVLLERHFPYRGPAGSELPDQPLLL